MKLVLAPVLALTLTSGCGLAGQLFGDEPAEAVDLQNPYRETGIPVRALCAADEVDGDCRPKTRKTWKPARAVGFQPLQLEAGALALDFPFGPTLMLPAQRTTTQSYEQLIDHFLFRAVDGSAVPRPCATDRLSSALRKEFTVFSPEQAQVNRLLAEDIARQTTLSAKVGLEPSELAALEQVEADLSSRLEEAVQHRLKESAVVRYIRVSATRDASDLTTLAALSECLGRPLVMEVTGILVTNKSSHREVLEGTDVKQAISAALAVHEGVPALKLKLEAKLGRAFDEVVKDRVSLVISESEPVFYPYYVRVDSPPAPRALTASPSTPAAKSSPVPRCLAGTIAVAGGAMEETQALTLCGATIDDEGRPTRATTGLSVEVQGLAEATPKTKDGRMFWHLASPSGEHVVTCECRGE